MIRLSITFTQSRIHYSLSTSGAAAYKHFQGKEFSAARRDKLLASFKSTLGSGSLENLKDAGEILWAGLMIPELSKALISLENGQDLELTVSENLMEIPFELMNDGGQFLGERFRIGRQVDQMEFWNSLTRELKHPLKILLISNPEGAPDLQHAQKESDAVDAILTQAGFQVSRKTDRPKDWLRTEIFSNDLLLFIGHSTSGGWSFNDGQLTYEDIRDLTNFQRTFPAGIIANSCSSATGRAWRRQSNSLCSAFLRSGVRFFVGTFWDIPDRPAGAFSQVFFSQLVQGKSLGAAMREAREQLIKEYGNQELIWASYVLYGSPELTLVNTPPPVPVVAAPVLQPDVGSYLLGGRILSTPMLDFFHAAVFTTGEPVTLALAHTHTSLDADASSALQRLARLEHPALPHYREMGQDGNRLYLVFDPLQGSSLQDLFAASADQPVEEKRAVNLLVQICDTFDLLHRMGYVYGALAPDKIYLWKTEDGEERVQIWGAGFQQVLESQEMHKNEPYYGAPEQEQLKPSSVDIWAIGAIGYRLLLGQDFNSVFAVTDHVGRAESLRQLTESSLPSRLVSILRRSLTIEPKERFTAGQMAQALREYDVETPSPSSDFSGLASDLLTCLEHERQLAYIVTAEEERAVQLAAAVAEHLDAPLYIWSSGRGLELLGDAYRREQPAFEALNWFMTLSGDQKGILLLKDFHDEIERPDILRQLLTIHARFRQQESPLRRVIILSPIFIRIDALNPYLRRFELMPPNDEEVVSLILDHSKKSGVALPDQQMYQFAWQALGLTENEIRHALDLSLVSMGGNQENVKEILQEQLMTTKRDAVLKLGLLDFEMPSITLKDVGGLNPLVLPEMVSAVRPALDSLGFIPVPKGWLLVGVPGSGKSLAARAIAGTLNLPLLRLDIGRLFGGYLGDTESSTYQVIDLCNRLSPLVLWIDEFEKAFSGQQGGGGGTLGRVWAIFLNWMQERRSPAMLVATANRLQSLPREIFRVGRFDAVLFFDTPGFEERVQIWNVLLHKYGLDSLFDKRSISELAQRSEGAAGAEMEQAVLNSIYELAAAPDQDFGSLLNDYIFKTSSTWRERTKQGGRENQMIRVMADGLGVIPANPWYRSPV
jgi:serine/threonine protein kinase